MRLFLFIALLFAVASTGFILGASQFEDMAMACHRDLAALREWVAGQGIEPGSPWMRM